MIPSGAAHNEMILGPEHERRGARDHRRRPGAGLSAMPGPDNNHQRSATISVLVDNESGVLARVIGLFSGRGYNIESLTVAAVDDGGGRCAHHRRHLRHARW